MPCSGDIAVKEKDHFLGADIVTGVTDSRCSGGECEIKHIGWWQVDRE